MTHGYVALRPEPTVCTITRRNGNECGKAVDPEAGFAICQPHLREAWGVVQRQIADLTPQRRHPYVENGRPKVGLIYFIRVQQRIKIGYTTDLPTRMSALVPDEILHTEPGTMQDEQVMHKKFAHLRAKAREYYHPEPELLDFIAALKASAAA